MGKDLNANCVFPRIEAETAVYAVSTRRLLNGCVYLFIFYPSVIVLCVVMRAWFTAFCYYTYYSRLGISHFRSDQ